MHLSGVVVLVLYLHGIVRNVQVLVLYLLCGVLSTVMMMMMMITMVVVPVPIVLPSH